MPLDDAALARAAEALRDAERGRAPVAPLAERFPGLSPADAYEIQLANVRRRLGEGHEVLGRKVGLTAKAMQHLLGCRSAGSASPASSPRSPSG